jgi:tetratricopeptide (TPR) repeat protein
MESDYGMAQLTTQDAFDLALQHHQAGRLQEAERLYRQVLVQQPEHAIAMHHLGLIAYQMGRNGVAVDLIRRAIALDPNLPDAHNNLGNALRGQGQLDEAIASSRHAIALKPNFPEAHNNLGSALAGKGQLDEAIAAFRQAILLNPNLAEVHRNLGGVLKDKGQLDEAIAAYRQAIALRPDVSEAHFDLGITLQAKKLFDEAVAAYRQTIVLRPNFAEAHSNLGSALKEKGKLNEAIAAYHQAIALNPNFPEAQYNLANALIARGQLDEAIAAYRQAITLRPEYAEAHGNLALALLMRGDFQPGWEEYEWRRKCNDSQLSPQNFTQPEWDGSPLEGRTLLLYTEQGFGDAIQFIRYLPLVAERGGKIIIACQEQLQRLFKMTARGWQIVSQGEPLPRFDLHCPLLSLPRVFRTTLPDIPKTVPYLQADAEIAKRWQHRLADHSLVMKVGIAWAGSPTNKNDRNRSMKLSSLAPLGQMPGVRFISLQKGKASVEAKTPPAGMQLIDWTEDLKDFANTAALIANLDLVIAVDTAVVHLAGAMGKPVWTLLPFVPDWRWLLERDDSPWYPSMQLFRQSSSGDWDSVVARVVPALSHWIENRT